MKKVFLILGLVFLAIVVYFVYTLANTRSHSPADEASITINGSEISISYCRPYKKGRVIFGELVPFNTYWRTGANDATEINFTKGVKFGDQEVAAGKYRFYTIPEKNQWTVVLNSELGEWGYGEPNYDLDVLRITVPTATTTKEVEQFTISFKLGVEEVNLVMEWDRTSVSVPIKTL